MMAGLDERWSHGESRGFVQLTVDARADGGCDQGRGFARLTGAGRDGGGEAGDSETHGGWWERGGRGRGVDATDGGWPGGARSGLFC